MAARYRSALKTRTHVTAVLGFAMMLFATRAVFAQCTVGRYSTDMSTSGTVKLQAATTQTNCVGQTARVEAWIDGLVYDCSGERTPDGDCYDEAQDSNAGTQAFDAQCGTWKGHGSHSYWPTSGGDITLLANTSADLKSRCNVEECTQMGGEMFEGECRMPTPIIIATSKNAVYRLTSPERGVLFDMDGDGAREQVAWTEAETEVAFLAIDRDGNGQITNGKELFGNATVPGARHGFEALQQMAMETNGGIERHAVSADDPLFTRLLLWTDRNHNGVSEASEIRAASDVLTDIGLGYRILGRRDRFDNVFRYQGWIHVRTGPGRNRVQSSQENRDRTRPIYDVYFRVLR